MKKNVLSLTRAALIATLYFCVSVAPGVSALSYGQIQLRIAEALMLLCLRSPSAVFGVSVGCFLANLFSPFGVNVFDLVFGTAATIFAALVTYSLKNVFQKSKFHIFLSPLPTIIFNALIVGSYLPFVTMGSFSPGVALFCMATVALGEIGVLYLIGIPLYWIVKNKNIM